MTTITVEINEKTNKAKTLIAILKEFGLHWEVNKDSSKAKIPNAETLKAMKEIEQGKTKRYSSAKAMFNELDK